MHRNSIHHFHVLYIIVRNLFEFLKYGIIKIIVFLIWYLTAITLFSHLQYYGSCKQIGHMTVPQSIYVLSFRLQAQFLHSFIIKLLLASKRV